MRFIMARRYCTIPEIFGVREWYEKNFGICCMAHDAEYASPLGKSRKEIDKAFIACMLWHIKDKSIFTKPFYLLFIGGSYIFVRCVGWYRFYKKSL